MNNFKKDFPIFAKQKITYLDSSATTQKPKVVLQKLDEFYKTTNANAHRGVYALSEKAGQKYEEARQKVANFVCAKDSSEIVFTRNATEAINLVAYSFGLDQIKAGDKIVITIMEHHSNLVPWQIVAQKTGAKLEYLYIDNNFEILDSELEKIDQTTKFVSTTLVSNVLGTKVDVSKIVQKAHKMGAKVLIDGAQAVCHMKTDVQQLDADFFVFSGHKMYAPLGIGVLYGKKELLEKMQPFLCGGGMIEYVTEQRTTFAPLPNKFEAGTQNIAGAVGLGYAIDYILSIGFDTIEKHEKELFNYAVSRLEQLQYVELLLPKDKTNCTSVISFNIKGVHSHDVASMLANFGVCVRSGNHCAQPLLSFLNKNSTARASFAIYNTKQDVDNLIDAIKKTYDKFKKYIEE